MLPAAPIVMLPLVAVIVKPVAVATPAPVPKVSVPLVAMFVPACMVNPPVLNTPLGKVTFPEVVIVPAVAVRAQFPGALYRRLTRVMFVAAFIVREVAKLCKLKVLVAPPVMLAPAVKVTAPLAVDAPTSKVVAAVNAMVPVVPVMFKGPVAL